MLGLRFMKKRISGLKKCIISGENQHISTVEHTYHFQPLIRIKNVMVIEPNEPVFEGFFLVKILHGHIFVNRLF